MQKFYKNVLKYCPTAEFEEGVDINDFQSVKQAAIKELSKFAKDELKWNNEKIERYKTEIELLKKFSGIQEKESLEISKSPYSESFYLHRKGEEITWNEKPEGSYRLSNHWNFDGHCESDDIGDNEIAIGRFCRGKYVKVN